MMMMITLAIIITTIDYSNNLLIRLKKAKHRLQKQV